MHIDDEIMSMGHTVMGVRVDMGDVIFHGFVFRMVIMPVMFIMGMRMVVLDLLVLVLQGFV